MQKLRKYLIILLIIISLSFILFNSKKEYLSEENILGVYVNNELSDNYPSKGSALFQKAVCDDSSTKVTWDNDNWGLLISNLNKKVKCNLYFYSGETVFDFDYTGGEQTFIAPVSGTYKLETWGAEGGSAKEYSGGQGGYSSGKICLEKNGNLFIAIGGRGTSDNGGSYPYDSKITGIGGYNGGANTRYNFDKSSSFIGSGGGATSIQNMLIGDGQLSNYKNNIANILIVSGGGGGANYWGGEADQYYDKEYGTGGAGGGFIGNAGTTVNSSNNYHEPGTGGTQTIGGKYDATFGTGGFKDIQVGSAGGGGGFYGGGGSYDNAGGGGGSGYIGNSLLTNKVMYCYNCEESNEESTKTISTTCSEETPTSNCAKKGNGYARITLVSIDE